MTSHYIDNISETGDKQRQVSFVQVYEIPPLTSSAHRLTVSRGDSESVPDDSDELLYKPSEQKVSDPAQTTTAAPCLSSQAANPCRRLWLSSKTSHVLTPFLCE